MFFSKLFSLFSNFLPFGIYLMVLSLTDKFSWVLRGILISIVVIQIICALLLKFVFGKESRKYPKSEKEYKIVRITRDRQSSLNFIVTNVFPLISLDLNNIGMIIFTVIILIVVTILFFKNNLYLYNPILEISGYKLYNLELEIIDKKETTHNVVSKTLVSCDIIPLNSKLKIKEFEDDIAF